MSKTRLTVLLLDTSGPFVASELTLEEQIDAYRQDIVSLLSKDPYCSIAQLLGQALMDLYSES